MMRPLTRGIWSGSIVLPLLLGVTIGATGPVDPPAELPEIVSSETQKPSNNGSKSETVGASSALHLTPRTLTPQTTEIPQKAKDLLQTIRERQGASPPGYVGGRAFHNRERRLPQGRYREYDVNPKIRGRPRDAERIVIEQKTGQAYYTADHYRTFVPFR
jgi:guanyl-specific ribonuclease Sa